VFGFEEDDDDKLQNNGRRLAANTKVADIAAAICVFHHFSRFSKISWYS